ncbi:hypothetical protein QR680_017899 [Steinernema hermaphroditum]|uniref:Uncharacterized protein n=1 Tax=Steinernema hermaphroditum TaxID=289476 RepID=A0AA39HIA9_9BILA|nr:hypothetical protein QR680_017899 [Steinernema hermaphroditum]
MKRLFSIAVSALLLIASFAVATQNEALSADVLPNTNHSVELPTNPSPDVIPTGVKDAEAPVKLPETTMEDSIDVLKKEGSGDGFPKSHAVEKNTEPELQSPFEMDNGELISHIVKRDEMVKAKPELLMSDNEQEKTTEGEKKEPEVEQKSATNSTTAAVTTVKPTSFSPKFTTTASGNTTAASSAAHIGYVFAMTFVLARLIL